MKHDNRVMEKVSSEIAIKKVELSTLVIELEQLVTNLNTLFEKICDDIPSYYKTIWENMDNIDVGLHKESKELHMDPSTSTLYLSKIIF